MKFRDKILNVQRQMKLRKSKIFTIDTQFDNAYKMICDINDISVVNSC